MKMESLQTGSVDFEKIIVTTTAKSGYPQQRTGQIPAQSKSPFRWPGETMTDSQSYGLMEERYGIQEEGIF